MRAARLFESFWIVLVAVILLLGAGVASVRAQAEQRAQWAKSGHANRLRPTQEATADGPRGVAAAHCGRCHSEQGFVAWVAQLERGNPGFIARPDGSPADVLFLVNLGLSRFSVRPVTCTACHKADFSLRMAGTTPLLPSGFRAIGVGLGAQCMLCHNSRNGAITWNAEDPRVYIAPHDSSQSDVLLGKNSYFVDYGNNFISPHASFIGDSCVTCHMRMSKEPHTFRADPLQCARCHGRDLTLARVQGPAKTMLRELETALKARILASRERIRGLRPWDPKTYSFGDPVAIDPAAIASVELVKIAGQQAVTFTMTDGRKVQTQIRLLTDATGRPTFATSDPLIRAGWNYWLLKNDASQGVHNPRFFRQVVLSSLEALR